MGGDKSRWVSKTVNFSFYRDIGFSFWYFFFTLRYYPPPLHSPSISPSQIFLLSFFRSIPYRSLSQTKQSRTRCDSPYVRLLGDNLYTRPPIITYSLDTSFWHESLGGFALPRFPLPVKRKSTLRNCHLSNTSALSFCEIEELDVL